MPERELLRPLKHWIDVIELLEAGWIFEIADCDSPCLQVCCCAWAEVAQLRNESPPRANRG